MNTYTALFFANQVVIKENMTGTTDTGKVVKTIDRPVVKETGWDDQDVEEDNTFKKEIQAMVWCYNTYQDDASEVISFCSDDLATMVAEAQTDSQFATDILSDATAYRKAYTEKV